MLKLHNVTLIALTSVKIDKTMPKEKILEYLYEYNMATISK